jgi:hypothetical protein
MSSRPNLLCLGLLAAVLGLITACTPITDATPSGAAEGAIRASIRDLVATPGYTSGTLSDEQADAWIDRVESALRPWYADDLVETHLRGVRNVVADHREHQGVIIRGVEVQSLSLGEARPSGDTVRFDRIVVEYRDDYAVTDVPLASPDKRMMCYLTVAQLTPGHWRVIEEGCNIGV